MAEMHKPLNTALRRIDVYEGRSKSTDLDKSLVVQRVRLSELLVIG